ncbi:hypothetical protein [Yoonia sp. SDW83-1]|uniref:hypothetical protein n=1 Tax=Yoonia sp. SDW83-1 TaxID=3366945 RepID=UPI00398C6DD8
MKSRPITEYGRSKLLDWHCALIAKCTHLDIACCAAGVAALGVIGGGTLGFLPFLSLWIIPLGIALATMDVQPVVQTIKSRKKRLE